MKSNLALFYLFDFSKRSPLNVGIQSTLNARLLLHETKQKDIEKTSETKKAMSICDA